MRCSLALCALLILGRAARAADAAEHARRRAAVMERARDGLVLVHSRSSLSWEASSFHQETCS